MELVFVIRKLFSSEPDESKLLYLNADELWTDDPTKAWTYSSGVVFDEAKRYGGLVFIRLPTGREILTSLDDFWEQ